MKPFIFRLDRLKRLRAQQHQHQQHQLERACAICDGLNAELRDRSDQTRTRESELQHQLEAGLTSTSLKSGAADVTRSEEQEKQIENVLAGANDIREENQALLFAAWRRLRLLERLEARARSKHAREEARSAQRDLDEVGSLSWWGRNR